MLRHRSDIIVFTKFGRRVERPDSRSWCAEVTWLTFVFEKAARMPLNTWAKEITAILGIYCRAETRKSKKLEILVLFFNSHDYRRILYTLKMSFWLLEKSVLLERTIREDWGFTRHDSGIFTRFFNYLRITLSIKNLHLTVYKIY